MGKNQEIAVEIKLTYTYQRPERSYFQEAKEQLEYHLKNGAKKAYLVTKKGDIGDFLIATIA